MSTTGQGGLQNVTTSALSGLPRTVIDADSCRRAARRPAITRIVNGNAVARTSARPTSTQRQRKYTVEKSSRDAAGR